MVSSTRCSFHESNLYLIQRHLAYYQIQLGQRMGTLASCSINRQNENILILVVILKTD